MPRRLRIHLPNGFYHVTLRGNHQQPIFHADGDRHLLNAIVGRALQKYAARIHAYCWMTNHLHLLVQVGEEPLGNVIRQIASGYARAFQEKLETRGHLFERRYFARLVSADAYLLAVVRYIHLNPVAAGVGVCLADYRWSSHRAYLGGWRESWLTTEFVLTMFAAERRAAQDAYRRFMLEEDAAWTPDQGADTPLEASMRIVTEARSWPVNTRQVSPGQALDDLVADVCQRFGVTSQDLLSSSRDVRLVKARGWVTREAVSRRIATLSEVARALGRDRSTLRHAMRLLPSEDPQPA